MTPSESIIVAMWTRDKDLTRPCRRKGPMLGMNETRGHAGWLRQLKGQNMGETWGTVARRRTNKVRVMMK